MTYFCSKSYSIQVGTLKKVDQEEKSHKKLKACTKLLLKQANLENNHSRKRFESMSLKTVNFFHKIYLELMHVLENYISSTFQVFFSHTATSQGSRDGAVVRALASH